MNIATKRTSHPHRSTTTPEYYFHLRGVSLSRQNGRQVNNVTAFVRLDKDGALKVSYAECDSRDSFSRAEGRRRARRKWFAGKVRPVDAATYDKAFADFIAEQAVADSAEPLFI